MKFLKSLSLAACVLFTLAMFGGLSGLLGNHEAGQPPAASADCLAPALIESEATLSAPCVRNPMISPHDGEKLARGRCLAQPAPEYRLLI